MMYTVTLRKPRVTIAVIRHIFLLAQTSGGQPAPANFLTGGQAGRGCTRLCRPGLCLGLCGGQAANSPMLTAGRAAHQRADHLRPADLLPSEALRRTGMISSQDAPSRPKVPRFPAGHHESKVCSTFRATHRLPILLPDNITRASVRYKGRATHPNPSSTGSSTIN